MTTPTQTPTLPKHISDEFDEKFTQDGFPNNWRWHGLKPDELKSWFAQTLETEVQKAVEEVDLLLAMVQSTTEDTPHKEIVEMIGNIRDSLSHKEKA